MEELIRVAARNDLGPGKAIAVEVTGQRIAVFNVDGTYWACVTEVGFVDFLAIWNLSL